MLKPLPLTLLRCHVLSSVSDGSGNIGLGLLYSRSRGGRGCFCVGHLCFGYWIKFWGRFEERRPAPISRSKLPTPQRGETTTTYLLLFSLFEAHLITPPPPGSIYGWYRPHWTTKPKSKARGVVFISTPSPPPPIHPPCQGPLHPIGGSSHLLPLSSPAPNEPRS